MNRPAMWFFPGDWLHDAGLRSCSPAARSLWLDMICLMHQSDPYGYLLVNHKVIQEDKLLVMLGGYPDGIKRLIDELDDAGVFSRNEDGCIYSRRMVRDEKIRLIRRECGSKGGNPKLKNKSGEQSSLVNQHLNHGLKNEDCILNTEELNTENCIKSNGKATHSSESDIAFQEFWKAYPRKVGKGAAEKAWLKVSAPHQTLAKILDSLDWQRNSSEWLRESGQFIPHPSTYLNQKRWEDEPAKVPSRVATAEDMKNWVP